MPATQTYIGTLVVMECGECHCHFGMSEDQYNRCLESGKTFYCTNGHPRIFARTENQKLKESLERAERRIRFAENATRQAQFEAYYERRSKAAVKGHLTRMRNKIANGVCPVPGCRRHFDNVQAHIRGQHAGWLEQHDIELDSISQGLR